MNVTIPKPDQKSHPMLKAGDSRSDIPHWRGDAFDWRTMGNIECCVETSSRILSRSDAHFYLLASKGISDLRYLKCDGIDDRLL